MTIEILKWLWLRFKLTLGLFGIRWKTGHIDCDDCGGPVNIYSDLTIDAHINPDQTILCLKCIDE
jgi:hypothetical protein